MFLPRSDLEVSSNSGLMGITFFKNSFDNVIIMIRLLGYERLKKSIYASNFLSKSKS